MSKYSLTKLKGKIHIKHGFAFKGDSFSDKPTDYIVLSPGNFYENGGFKRQQGKEKFYIGEIPEGYLHQKDDLIIAMTEQAEGLLGSCARIPDSETYLHNQRLGLITIKSDTITKEFLYHLSKAEFFRKQIQLTSSGSKVKHTSPERIYDVLVPLPTIEEQKKIAYTLDLIEDKLSLNKSICSELEAMVKTLYDYWFVQFDFPNVEGKPYKSSGGKMVYNKVLKRKIPERWEAKYLVDITSVSNESIDPAKNSEMLFKLYSIPVFDVTSSYSIEKGISIGSNKFIVEELDLLVSKLNPWFNRVVYALDLQDQICSTEFVVWRCPNLAIKNVMYLIATSDQFIAHCTQSATGTSNSHKRVNPNVMMGFVQPFDLEIAEQFGETIDPIIKTIMTNRQENLQLEKLRDWLLPMLMNGQVTPSSAS